MSSETEIWSSLANLHDLPDQHPSGEELIALREGGLGEAEQENLREHLAHCPVCSTLYLRTQDFLDAERRVSAKTVPTPTFEFLAAMTGHAFWRQAAVFATGLALGIGCMVMIRSPEKKGAARKTGHPAVPQAIELQIKTISLYEDARNRFEVPAGPEAALQLLFDPADALGEGSSVSIRRIDHDGVEIATAKLTLNDELGVHQAIVWRRLIPPGRYTVLLLAPDGSRIGTSFLIDVLKDDLEGR